MKRIIAARLVAVFILTSIGLPKSFAQNPNFNFSSNDFSNWSRTVGVRGNCCSTPNTSAASYVIVNTPGNDYLVGAALPRIPSGKTSVARVGNPSGGGNGGNTPLAWAINYSILVTAENPILHYEIAGVTDGTHSCTGIANGLPLNSGLHARITDQSGNPLANGNCYDYIIQSCSQGTFQMFPAPVGTEEPYYFPWSSVGIDLSAYIGQTINFQFGSFSCYYAGYHGNTYGYVAPNLIAKTDTILFCKNDASVTINGLERFLSYHWSTGAVTQQIVINNPRDDANYTCTYTSFNGCSMQITYILKEIKTDAGFNYAGGGGCNQIQFYDQSVSNGNEVVKWEWTFGDAASGSANYNTSQNPLHTYPGPGNYTVSLTVTDTFGCTNTISKTVSVSPEGTVAQIGLPQHSCINDTLAILDLTANASRRTWFIDGQQLEDTAKSLQHIFNHTGWHEITLIATGSNGCPDTAIQSLQVFGLPKAAIQVIPFTNATPITDPEFNFKGLEENAARYVWDFGYAGATGEGQYSNFTYPPEVAEYKVLLKTYDKNGCHDIANAFVSVMPPDFMIPNAFSPNGDGNNDVFRIINITNQNLKEFSIYNRYRQRVFYTIDTETGWDGTFNGKLCDVGTYHYLVRYSMPGNDKEYVVKGDVILIR